MGKLSKSRGKAYEYRVAKWFQERKGWEQSFRIPLSGASERITQEIAGHDVLAHCSIPEVKIACECKKTNGTSLRLEHIWFEKLNYQQFGWEKVLIFAFGRSPHYAIIPFSQFTQLYTADDFVPDFIAKGKRFFSVNFGKLRDILENKRSYCYIEWPAHKEQYVVLELSQYIEGRERRAT